MSEVRNRKSRTSKQKTHLELDKQTNIPFGKSHIDYLPEDVLYHVYHFKHQLEFQPTLAIVSKLRIAVDSEIVETRTPIKKLLEKATNKKQIYIDVMPFKTPTTDDKALKVQQEFNTSKIQFHQGFGALCQIELKFIQKIQLLIIDILHIIYQLGLTKRLNKVLVDIQAQDIHHKTSCIRFKME